MTPQEQQIAIAEACGWWWARNGFGEWYLYPPGHVKFTPDWMSANSNPSPDDKNDGRVSGGMHNFPDYLNDLNAMHEAEKVLTLEQKHDYLEHLICLLEREIPEFEMWWEDHQAYCEGMYTTYATAAQRAEALLRVKGKWKQD